MGQLQSGLTKSTEGLEKVSNGLGDAQKYLGELNESKALRNLYSKRSFGGRRFPKSFEYVHVT